MPMVPMPPAIGDKFDQQMLSGGMPQKFRMGKRQPFGFGPRGGAPCRINNEEVKTLLK